MKLIKAKYEIITAIDGENILKQIELAARTCYKSEGKIEYGTSLYTPEHPEFEGKYAISARKLITKLIASKHLAMIEFGGSITVKFICDRGISHELVRHRIASFAQESTRYCNYGKDDEIQFVIPDWTGYLPSDGVFINIDEPAFNTLREVEMSNPIHGNNLIWLTSMQHAEKNYLRLVKNGWTPQQARSVLPNSLKTEINVSANLREWRTIFEQRTAKTAHPQMREVMIPLLAEFKTRIPIIFDDIIV